MAEPSLALLDKALIKKIFLTMLPGVILWCIPTPTGLTIEAWHLFAIFVSLILGLIIEPIPMAAIALAASAVALSTQTVTFNGLFKPYSQPAIWLVLFAFFLSIGFVKTRLSERVSYHFISYLGKTTIGLSYGIVLSELFLSPFIPSTSARSGGVIYPIASALANQYVDPKHPAPHIQTAKFILLTAFHMSSICGAMTLTAMAGNPIMVQMAGNMGIEMTWGVWALAASLPGVLSLIVVPTTLYFLLKPEIRVSPEAPNYAREKLQEMGPMHKKEWIMFFVFLGILVLWIVGPSIGIEATVTIMVGLGMLELLKVINWEDCLREKAAWNAFLWMGVLLGMAGQLKELQFFDFIGDHAFVYLVGFSPQVTLVLLGIIYFYFHYFFASNIGHIAALYATFVLASIQMGVPPLLSALVFAFLSNLFGGLTHYASGPASIYYGSGLVSIGEWWKIGIIVSILHLTIWLGVGMVWWRIIGLL